MIPEIGHFCVVLALCLALAQSAGGLIGPLRRQPALIGLSEQAAFGQFAALLIAFLALMWAYVASDFSVANVAENSHSLKPMLYKVTGVWGNHEGSLLMWVLMLALFGALIAGFGRNLPISLRGRVLGVQGLIGIGFLLFALFTSNPFLRLDPPPMDGQDLNPLLQDPALAFHPPFLYLGYVGFSVAFSFAIAALIEGRVDAAWARWVRPWTLLAWAALTLGIAMGSWWAYYELGWGGWWFWDPVENVSFMPWLAGTALLHSAIVTEKRDALKSWTILLAILTFSLSLLGTFIVRSGLLTSVHAFAVDPERGVFILALLALATGGGLLLYALRAPAMAPGGVFAPVSREGALILNNLLLCTALLTVFVGTLYPLVAEALGDKISVGPPYYNATFVPLMVPLVAAMAVGPMLSWKRADLRGGLQRLSLAAAATAVLVLICAYLYGFKPVMALVGVAMAAWAFLGAVTDFAERIRLGKAPLAESRRRLARLPRSAYGTLLAHAGLGVAIAGMTGSAGWMSENIAVLRPGENIAVAGYEATLKGVQTIQGPNYTADQATLIVRDRSGDVVATLTPSRRFYPVAAQQTTEAAIHTTWLADIYAAIGENDQGAATPRADKGWVVRFYHHPLVPWIWIGAIIMVFGGAVSLSDRRLRIGAPQKTRSPAPTGAVAAE